MRSDRSRLSLVPTSHRSTVVRPSVVNKGPFTEEPNKVLPAAGVRAKVRKLSSKSPVLATIRTRCVPAVRVTLPADSVFQAPKSIIKKGDWVDRASVGIPALYVSTGFMLSEAQRTLGNTAEAQRVLATAEGVARATRLSDLFSAVQQLPPLGAEGDSRSTAIPLPISPDSPKPKP